MEDALRHACQRYAVASYAKKGVNVVLTVVSVPRSAARGEYRSTSGRACLGNERRDVKYETAKELVEVDGRMRLVMISKSWEL